MWRGVNILIEQEYNELKAKVVYRKKDFDDFRQDSGTVLFFPHIF